MLEVIFKVPEHVLLPEDVAQRKKHSAKGHKKILKEIESLRAEIQTVFNFFFIVYVTLTFIQSEIILIQEKYKEAVFKGKLKEATETLENLKTAALEIETTSYKILRENQTTDLKENSKFILEKFEKCKTQLDGLRELAPPSETTTNMNAVFRQKEIDLFKNC